MPAVSEFCAVIALVTLVLRSQPVLSGFVCGSNVVLSGQSYRTVQIGSQCWFRDNLNATTTTSGTTLTTSGRLCGPTGTLWHSMNDWCRSGGFYTWDAAMDGATTIYPLPTAPVIRGLCPAGWHIPTRMEWDQLLGTVADFPSKRLQAVGNDCLASSVACYRIGTSGFDAPLGGYFTKYSNTSTANFDARRNAYYWSASRAYDFKTTVDSIFIIKLRWDNHRVEWTTANRADYLSVRCVLG
eukprot:TRINITY_DN3154_c0_g1_i1.p1 TRINITY_DN3154_c0_g1~~TRINITY_DN3154_c0_g1_i1.p1  ORF type:complete len:241 (+),score=22.77 TRINITY_DN3154_c0_g1_i1:39-761(+)